MPPAKARRPGIDPTGARAAVRSVSRARCARYAEYWRHCRPKTPEAVWARYVYAYASVNRNWICHMQLFRRLCGFDPGFSAAVSPKAFAHRLRRSGQGGMYGVTAAGVWGFDRDFSADPDRFAVRRARPAARDAIAAGLHGLGRAKTAFALELLDPVGCRAVCIDRHIARTFGVQPTDPFPDEEYAEAEAFWVAECDRRNLPPAVVRFAFWDDLQRQRDCRYWSACLEPWVDVKAWAAGWKLRW